MTIGVDALPPLPKHAGDRNRTSPFAFTGNKFEFRAVGSGQSIAGPLVVLNTAVAESLDYAATELEKATGGDPKKLAGAVQKLVSDIYKQHKAVVFNGDNYTAEWHAEAEKRKLPNLKNTVTALPALIAEKNLKLFAKYEVLSEREVHSRYDIYMERYCKDINMESQQALSIAKTQLLPAAYRYQGVLASVAASLKAIGKNPSSTRCWRNSWRVNSTISASARRVYRGNDFSRIAVIVSTPARRAGAAAAGLRAPDIHRMEFARDGHRGQDADPHVQGALEPHIGAEMRDALRDFRGSA